MKKFNFLNKLLVLTFLSFIYSSCVDNSLELHKPSWLGESIYNQLETGYTDDITGKVYSFKTYIKLVDDLGYSEVLKLTGSKTLFVADDAAFESFYKTNPWGVKSYEGLTIAQKKLLFNSSMIDNAYLIELMSSTSSASGPVQGQALRRTTALSVLDTITYVKPTDLPLNTNWDDFRDKGIYLVNGNTAIPMVHFLPKMIEAKGITNSDFSKIMNEKAYQQGEAYIYGNKVEVKDIVCKNGYMDILDSVLIPASNMAEVIRTKPDVSIFSSFIERFSAPYYNEALTNSYKLLNPTFNDKIYVKSYFAERTSTPNMVFRDIATGKIYIANDKPDLQSAYLEYDPGWNTCTISSNMQTDMATMFVPTDDALKTFFATGGGRFLTEQYGAIENIPNDVLVKLVRNHMKPSFFSSLPHSFSEVLDDAKRPMGITTSNVVKSYMANNGVVYVTDRVYPPAAYSAVTAPILINNKCQVVNKEVADQKFDAYLLSMDSRYSFFVPVDKSSDEGSIISPNEGMYYVDPVSYSKKQPLIFKFYPRKVTSTSSAIIVAGTAYKYDVQNGLIGDSVGILTTDVVNNRFNDILDYHVVVGDVESGKKFYQTKGGGSIKVDNNSNGSLKVFGGGNMELKNFKTPAISQTYDQTKEGNGKTYLTNSPLLPPYKSVYKVLSENPEFSEFFKLLLMNDLPPAEAVRYAIFKNDPNHMPMAGDYNVASFNTYNYTVYVPTNNAVQNAINRGLPTWELINQQTDQAVRDSLSNILVNFLRYHFQDNSVYIDGTTDAGSTAYETAAYTTKGTKAYYKLYAKRESNALTVYSDKNDPSTAVTVDNAGLFNIMARDYKFNSNDIEMATGIYTSSWAVIHQVNDVLLYDKSILNKAQQLIKKTKRRISK